MSELPRELRRKNRIARSARARHDANRIAKIEKRRRRIKESETHDPLRSKGTSPRGSSTGFRKKAR